MSQVQFHWQREAITERLLIATGSITLEWSMIDHQITKMVEYFWTDQHPNQPIPRPFDKRVAVLRDFADELYKAEPDEWIVFRWYIQRLKESNGKRDAIAHGQPGTVTKGGRTYPGLMIPYPSKATSFVPITEDQIVELANKMLALNTESHHVSGAFWAALAAASPNKHFSQVDGKWTQLTTQNRHPKLPRIVPPPPTFRG